MITVEGMSDPELARQLASLIGQDPLSGEARFVTAIIPGNPACKSRPRVDGKGRVYHDPKDRQAERDTAKVIRAAIGGRQFTGNVAVGCVFFRADLRQADADNMLKHVCDAANKVAWPDDSQVTALYAGLEHDPVNPRTVLVITTHASTMRRGVDDVVPCEGCGDAIPRRNNRKYCTTACARRAAITARGANAQS